MYMGLFPKITCQKCRREFSGHMNKCPHCGTRRQAVSSRAATTTDRARTARSSKAAVTNAQWQFAFGLILVTVVMLSVVVLITTNLNSSSESAEAENNLPSEPTTIEPVVTATPAPTPTPTPVVTPTSIEIYYLTTPIDTGFTSSVGDELQLSASVYPLDITSTVSWRSTDTSVFTVDQTGKVVGVASGVASLIAECGGIQAECQVIIK